MFCGNCGREIADNSTSCIYCGEAQTVTPVAKKVPFNVNAVVAICCGLGSITFCYFAIIPAIAGVVCGCLGLSHANKYGSGKKGLAITGIISGSIIIALSLILLIIFIAAVSESSSSSSYYHGNYYY